PGYLHLPDGRGSSGPPPCVIMVNGADSVKEEYHNWARQFVRRGLAALTVDGPGQGEMLGLLPMRPEAWERPMAACIDVLRERGDVDPERIGIWGSSMGGFYDFRDYRHWPLSTQLNVMEDLGVESLSEARAYVDERCTLEGAVERIE